MVSVVKMATKVVIFCKLGLILILVSSVKAVFTLTQPLHMISINCVVFQRDKVVNQNQLRPTESQRNLGSLPFVRCFTHVSTFLGRRLGEKTVKKLYVV